MQGRIFKYLIYIIGLPAIGFVSMVILKPVTAGAHDGGFLGMIFGLIIGQVIFTFWLTNFKWYSSILVGLVLGFLTIVLSYSIIGILRNLFNPIQDEYYFRPPNETLESILPWVFFLVLLLSSIALLELLIRVTTKESKE